MKCLVPLFTNFCFADPNFFVTSENKTILNHQLPTKNLVLALPVCQSARALASSC